MELFSCDKKLGSGLKVAVSEDNGIETTSTYYNCDDFSALSHVLDLSNFFRSEKVRLKTADVNNLHYYEQSFEA